MKKVKNPKKRREPWIIENLIRKSEACYVESPRKTKVYENFRSKYLNLVIPNPQCAQIWPNDCCPCRFRRSPAPFPPRSVWLSLPFHSPTEGIGRAIGKKARPVPDRSGRKHSAIVADRPDVFGGRLDRSERPLSLSFFAKWKLVSFESHFCNNQIS